MIILEITSESASLWVELVSSTQFSRNMKIVSKKTKFYAEILRVVSS